MVGLMEKDDKVLNAIKQMIWMARRYADGRRTLTPSNFNYAYDTLREIYGTDIEYIDSDKWVDTTLMEDGKYFPYAQDGGGKNFDCVTGRKYWNERNISNK